MLYLPTRCQSHQPPYTAIINVISTSNLKQSLLVRNHTPVKCHFQCKQQTLAVWTPLHPQLFCRLSATRLLPASKSVVFKITAPFTKDCPSNSAGCSQQRQDHATVDSNLLTLLSYNLPILIFLSQADCFPISRRFVSLGAGRLLSIVLLIFRCLSLFPSFLSSLAMSGLTKCFGDWDYDVRGVRVTVQLLDANLGSGTGHITVAMAAPLLLISGLARYEAGFHSCRTSPVGWRVSTCGSVHSWWLYSAVSLGHQTTGTIACYPAQWHYPYTERPSPCPILIIPSTRLGSDKY